MRSRLTLTCELVDLLEELLDVVLYLLDLTRVRALTLQVNKRSSALIVSRNIRTHARTHARHSGAGNQKCTHVSL